MTWKSRSAGLDHGVGHPTTMGRGLPGAEELFRRPVRRSKPCSIPIADGQDAEEILGSTAYLNPKGRGDKRLPIKPGTVEDAYIVARQDPRDMAKAGWLQVQC